MKGEREKAINENTLIAQLNPALQAKDWATAEQILTKLIAMNPESLGLPAGSGECAI